MYNYKYINKIYYIICILLNILMIYFNDIFLTLINVYNSPKVVKSDTFGEL